MIKINAEISPLPFKRVLTCGDQRFNPTQYRKFKEELGWLARRQIRKPTIKPVSIELRVYRELPPESLRFGDIDNHLKAVLDSLNGIAYLDDRQVVAAQIELHRGRPHLEIVLEEMS
ncbi:MAG: RusA family crossover junction endodeoxyribonuclease [Quinella sp. 1Q5]|nr:RusA family crossover junction endodeoxyribonuclease [Quinella sp. 1Q5]